MSDHTNLHTAARNKDDEFYTEYDYIDNEVKHYTKFFKDKVVYCPCDDYRWSNFPKYFKNNFEKFGIKKLIASCYNSNGNGTLYIYDGEKEVVKEMFSNGDFQHEEVKSVMRHCDIIVTNPPFSLIWRLFDIMMNMKKDFLIVAPFNMFVSATGKFIEYIKSDDIRIGTNKVHNGKFFKDLNKQTEFKNVKCNWLTNFKINLNDPTKRKFLNLTKSINDMKYKYIENTDFLNVDKSVDIPKDYNGYIAVPVTFIDKWNPKQFELIGTSGTHRTDINLKDMFIDGKQIFSRLIVKPHSQN